MLYDTIMVINSQIISLGDVVHSTIVCMYISVGSKVVWPNTYIHFMHTNTKTDPKWRKEEKKVRNKR